MDDKWIWIYFGIINLISAGTFIVDKKRAQKKKSRVTEAVLHFLEAIGGVFSVFILMYVIQHKSRKSKYFLVNWFILVWWLVIYLLMNNSIQWTFFIKKHH